MRSHLLWNLLCLVLVTLLSTSPSFASDDGITDISITPIPALSGQSSTHELTFVATRELTSGQVQVEYPLDFYVAHARVPAGSSVSGQKIIFSLQRPIGAGERVTLRAEGIINPTIPATYKSQVSTGSMVTLKQIAILAADRAVTEAWMDATNLLPGQTTDNEVNFVTTSGLPAGGTVKVEYPAGFILSGATLPEGDGLTLQEVSGQTIFYRASRSFPVGHHFWGAFQTRGIVNPAEPGRYLLRVSTSSDPTPVYLPYLVRPGGAVSAAAIAVTSVTAGQTSSYTFSFSPTTGVPEGGSVTLEFPAGFAPVVENSADGRYSVESVSGQTVTLRMIKAVEAWVYRPGMWYHGIETPGLSISAKNVVNPSVPGSYLFNIWTSNDTAKAAVSIVIYRPLLSISFAGSGNGSVNGGYSCLSPGVCSFTPMVPTVTLVPTPDADSIFAGWSGACTASSGSCEVVMDGNRHATATFNLVEKARFQGRPYQALTAAFAEQASGTVEARATEFAEALVVSAPKRFKGGFDRGFASNKGGLSVLKGSLVIRPGGSLIAEGLAIR